MRAKTGFNLRTVCGENIVVAEGEENIDFSNIISMNESSAYLWRNIQDKQFSIADLVDLMMQEYDVDEPTATNDVKALVEQWKQAGIIE